MPKILRIINRLNLGGPTYNAAFLSKYMPDEYETMLVAGIKDYNEESSEFIAEQLGLKPVNIPEMKREINFSNDRTAYKKIKQLIKDFKPDIVHTHASKAGTLGRLAARSCKVPVIVHTFHGHVFHSYFSPLKTQFYIQIERYLAGISSAIVAISESQKHELGSVFRICRPEKIHVIPLGLDLEKFNTSKEANRKLFRNKYLLADDEIAIGIIGRIVPVKNHQLFLEALSHVLKNSKMKIRAFIIGDGDDRLKIEACANALGIVHSDATVNSVVTPLTFTSWIKEIELVYAGLDIVALSSLNEGTPVSLIEAQAAGKPIVTTAVGGIENIVLPGKTALLSEKNDVQAFSANMLNMTENETLRLNMSKEGYEHVINKFSYLRLVKDMDALYKKLLAKT